MYLYFQFFTQNQSIEAVELLRAINLLVNPIAPLKGNATIRAQAAASRRSFKDLEVFTASLKTKRFNRVDVTPSVPFLRNRSGRERVVTFKGVFTPSPVCALWFPTKEWRIDADRGSRNDYMSTQSREEFVAAFAVTRYPSVIEIFMEIKTKKSEEKTFKEWARQIADNLPESLKAVHVFGCCDIVKPLSLPHFKEKVIIPQRFEVLIKVRPPSYPKLGKRFDTLHPLMFGPKRLCEKIVTAIGAGATLTVGTRVKDFAVVRLRSSCDVNAAMRRAAKWLLVEPRT